MPKIKALLFAPILLWLHGCTGPQSMFSSVGEEGEKVIIIWWILFGLSLAVFLLIIFALTMALIKKGSTDIEPNDSRDGDKNLYRTIYASTFVVILLLASLLITSHQYSPRQKVATKPDVTIKVTGLLYWWRVEYLDKQGEVLFETANEFKIPVHKNVHLILESDDVIHSFWLPRVGGKMDMIPGRTTHLNLKAKKKGRFRGQCAEFCGVQHAKMSFYVDVISEKEFNQYQKHQRAPATSLVNQTHMKGQNVFQSVGCIGCHDIRGKWSLENPMKPHQKMKGPDLTHLKSRQTLAAATFPNTTGHLSGWIVDPQSPKKGNLMPPTKLSSEDFKNLLQFLEALE